MRATTERLASVLSAEDQTVQTMPDVSPTKWHRAHVTWFFETFVLGEYDAGYRRSTTRTRTSSTRTTRRSGPGTPGPSAASVPAGHRGDRRATAPMSTPPWSRCSGIPATARLAELITLGLHHEQQHQELLLMDIKHVLSRNPLHPAYLAGSPHPVGHHPPKAGWLEHDGGPVEIGHRGEGFGFDNEFPVHTVHLTPFGLADRPVTCGEWLSFMEDDGYRRPEFWLSDGWAVVNAQHWEAPLYWSRDPDDPDRWLQFTLSGLRPVDPDEPVCHVSYYEADAFAHWTGMRLPTESEWETIAAAHGEGDNFLGDDSSRRARPTHGPPCPPTACSATSGSGRRAPTPPTRDSGPRPGAVGEYNGKFMVSQYVLRGGCCATPRGHVRATYRNFFPPGRPLVVRRRAAGPGPLSRWRTRSTSTSRPTRCGARCEPTPWRGCGPARSRSRPCGSTTSGAAACSRRSRSSPSTTPPGPSGPCSSATPPPSPSRPRPTRSWSWVPERATRPACS